MTTVEHISLYSELIKYIPISFVVNELWGVYSEYCKKDKVIKVMQSDQHYINKYIITKCTTKHTKAVPVLVK